MANQVNPNDQPLRPADVYYRSGQPSAVRRSPHTRVLRPIPTPPATDPKVAAMSSDQVVSSDKYYRSYGGKVTAIPVVPRPGAPAVEVQAGLSVVTVRNEAELREKLALAIAAARSGPVEVRLVQRELLARARMQVEFAVTRQQLSEAQGRDIRFSFAEVRSVPAVKLTPAAPALPRVLEAIKRAQETGAAVEAELEPPAPLEVPSEPITSDYEMGEDLGDPRDFVYGQGEVDNPQPVVEDDAADDTPPAEESPAEDDDDA